MAESQDQAQERTEQATPKRLQDAKEKGQVPRSRELATTAILVASSGAMFLLGPSILKNVTDLMANSFRIDVSRLNNDIDFFGELMLSFGSALTGLAGFFVIAVAVSVLSPVALGGWSLSPNGVAFKWEKLDPIKGLGRIFSANGLMEFTKAFIKFFLVTGVTGLLLWVSMEKMLLVNTQSFYPAVGNASYIVLFSFLLLSFSTLLLTFFDVPFQLWNHAKQMRMTRQDIKEEHKDSEGKPEVKARIRALQREVAQRRMMDAVPQADVVITNPTHFAVALRYDAKRMNAPLLVAKGADLLAMRIREVAQVNNVPVISAPSLARAVYFSTKVDREIPAGLYLAVAQVLAYVYRLSHGKTRGNEAGFDFGADIPEEYRR